MKLVAIIISVLILSGCHTSGKLPMQSFEQKITAALDTSSVLSTGFTGLVVYDLQENKIIFSRNASRYFVPASNTKLFTLYACMKTLGDSIPGLRYLETDTSLIFWGTGDPTLLHPYFSESKTMSFLKSKSKTKKLYYSDSQSSLQHYGTGWMWDDYNDYYQAELTPFPMFGNVILIRKDSSGLKISPEMTIDQMGKKSGIKQVRRMMENNHFDFPDGLDTMATFEQEVPYKNASKINIEILEKILESKITSISTRLSKETKTLYSIPTDTVYRRMMQVSDNMLAEHLLLLCGSTIGDSISTKFSIDTMTAKYISDIPDKPAWVDGAGLSRYNLFTPMSIVTLLQKMYREYPEDKLFSLLAVGGGNGTLKHMFNAEQDAFIFAKSGSMSGVYNLSGYMITSSGKRLIFSFMNNNFNTSVSSVKKEVAQILTRIKALK